MTIINFAGNCHAPETVQVTARTRMFGLYEIAVWQWGKSWLWAVLLNEQEVAHGTSRTEAGAQRAAQAAAQRQSLPRPPIDFA